MDAPETVKIDGHTVDAHRVDQFFNGRDGSRVTDEQWDESQRRLREAEAAGPGPFDEGYVPPEVSDAG